LFQAPDGWFVKAAGVKLDKTTLRTVLQGNVLQGTFLEKPQGTFPDKIQGTFLEKTQGTFLEKTPPPAPSAKALESSKVMAKKIEVQCIDQYFDIPMFDFDDDDDSSSEEESVHEQQQHEQQQQEHNEQQQQQLQQQQQQQREQHNSQGCDNNNKRDKSQLKNEKIPHKLNVVKDVIDSAPSTSTVNRDAFKTHSELETFQDTLNPSIYLISQSIGFSVKNKFVTEETLKKLLNLQAEKKKII
jgi:hypothetical protein